MTALAQPSLPARAPRPAARHPLRRWLGMAGLSTVIVLAGCATPMDARKDAQYQSYGNAASRPTVRPVRSVSSFSDSLMCMDQMLREANITTTLVTSKLIPDASLRVPVATKEMIITALSQMSRLSNAFRYVDYEVDIARQDTVQNLTTILLNNNQIQLQRPSLYISGAVAFVDQNVLSNRFDAGTSASRLETGYSRDRNVTVVGLELHLGDFRSRTLIPGMDSANEVIIGTGGQGLDVAGRIGDYGLQFNVGRDYAQGTGAAIRTLVELAMIELVGKWARVPYWQCLTLEQNHPDFQRQLRDWYDEGGDKVHQGLVRRSLVAKGYLPGGEATPPVNSLAFRRALARFQADNRMVVTGTVNFPTYERVLRDFVALDANGQLTRYGWMSQDPTPVQPLDDPELPIPSSGLAYGARTPARTIDLQIENVLLGRSVFEVGEQVFLSATVSQASHMACYLSDSGGNVMRLIPNPIATQAVVPGNQAVRIPDWMSPNPGFVLATTAPGQEGVLCAATGEDVTAKLPAPLQGAALRPMPEFRGLDAVAKAYTDAVGADAVSLGRVNWTVGPRRPAAAAAPATAPAPAAQAPAASAAPAAPATPAR